MTFSYRIIVLRRGVNQHFALTNAPKLGKLFLLCGYGGIGRRAGFRVQCLRRAGSSPVIRILCDMLPPLKSLILKWGLLAQWLYRAKYLQAILACPAIFISPVTDFLLCCHAHSAKILFPSFMMLTAAFTSRSILLPHSQ